MSALAPTSLPAQPINRTCRQRPCSRPAPSAHPLKALAPLPRSGIAGLPARGPWPQWPELTVATGSSRSSIVHTAPGYLYPLRHSQAMKQLWFGRALTQYIMTCSSLSRCPFCAAEDSRSGTSSLAPVPSSLSDLVHLLLPFT